VSHSIKTRLAEQFTVELDANPTTGYEWQVEFPRKMLRLVRRELSPPGPEIGGAVKQRFVFEALSKGNAVLELSYKRSWEPRALEARKISVQIRE